MGWDLCRLKVTHSPHLPHCISFQHPQSNMTPDNIFSNPCWHILDKPFVFVNCLHRCRHPWTGCSYSWICTALPCTHIAFFMFPQADPSGRMVWGMDLWPFACWECGFKSCQGHGCLSLVDVVCNQVEVSVSSWSFVQRNPSECGVSNECYCKAP